MFGVMDTLANIRARRAEIARLREQLGAEDEELATAEKVVARLEAGAPKANGSDLAHRGTRVRVAGKHTNKELIIATLRASETPWLESSGLLHAKIKEIHGVSINYAGTFLPILSDMKKEKVIVRDGPKIALTERVQAH